VDPETKNDADMQEGAVLFADVSGSTSLYQAIGDQAAFAAIQAFLQTLRSTIVRHEGVFVKTSGDDVLCWFHKAPNAVAAANQMMQATSDGDLEVHAGLEWGSFVCVQNDIFGDCVNAAARLCALANQRELLVGALCFEHLDGEDRAKFVSISPLRLRGRREAASIHSLQMAETGDRTHFSHLTSEAHATWDALVEYEGQQWRITEGDVLTVGRLADNTVLVPHRSVSRLHATVRLTNGLVEFEDHSSTGSAVIKETGEQLVALRQTVVLSGKGTVFLGAKTADPGAPRLFYDVVPR
jgi:adenylate cyclase